MLDGVFPNTSPPPSPKYDVVDIGETIAEVYLFLAYVVIERSFFITEHPVFFCRRFAESL